MSNQHYYITKNIKTLPSEMQIPAKLSNGIQIDSEKSKIRVVNHRQQLTYLLLSTQPGRKITHPPTLFKLQESQQRMLEFDFQNCDGISVDKQGYCAVGFDSQLKKVEDLIIKKPVTSVLQKSIYISKINADFKPLSSSYFTNPQKRYKYSLTIQPPNDITAPQIQQLLQKFLLDYGQISQIDTKRNTLMLTFQQDKEIKQNFFIKGFNYEENNHLTLTYWAITYHRTLYTYQPIKLIQLPKKQKIKEFIIHSEWIIMCTGEEVLFLHLYRPTQLFQTINDIRVHAVSVIDQDKVILFEYKFHYVYQLFSYKNPVLLGKGKTKKIQPYTVAFKKKTALFGGINYSAMLNQPTKQKQIHVIENFSYNTNSTKSFPSEKKLYICKKLEQSSVRNMKYLQKQDLFLCSCSESLYLFHLQTSSLIASVDLTAPILKLYEIQYPINIVNCLVKVLGEKYLVRIGFEQYGEIVGTEVSCVEKFGDIVDFVAEGKEICSTDGDTIVLNKDDKNGVLYNTENQGEKIKKIAMSNGYFCFLLCKQSILQAYFMEL